MMNTYICKRLPNNLEFGAVTLAENEEIAKQNIKNEVEREGWLVHIDEILVRKVHDTEIIDPANNY